MNSLFLGMSLRVQHELRKRDPLMRQLGLQNKRDLVANLALALQLVEARAAL